MYCISSYNSIYFLKFIIHKINSKMVKSKMMKLTGREKTDVDNADVYRLVQTTEGEKKLTDTVNISQARWRTGTSLTPKAIPNGGDTNRKPKAPNGSPWPLLYLDAETLSPTTNAKTTAPHLHLEPSSMCHPARPRWRLPQCSSRVPRHRGAVAECSASL
jgi:hypothetical protein